MFRLFKRKYQFIDSVEDRRIGLLYIYIDSQKRYVLTSNKNNYNCILEVVELFNDKSLSKLKIVNVAYTEKPVNNINFNPWVESDRVHWLSPSTPIDRDNKLKKLLNQ